MSKLGNWEWYFGDDDDDDEMLQCRGRDAAIAEGLRNHVAGESFFIIEARMLVRHEEQMESGSRDTAPFARFRNGCRITISPDGAPVEGPP